MGIKYMYACCTCNGSLFGKLSGHLQNLSSAPMPQEDEVIVELEEYAEEDHQGIINRGK